MEIDFSDLSKKSLEQTDILIQQFGPRLTGSDSCQQVAEELALSLSEFCDETKIEDFNVYPDSFSFYVKFLPIMFFLSGILLYLNSYWVILPLVGLLLGIIMMIYIFGFYKHFFDRFFPKKIGKNVYLLIERIPLPLGISLKKFKMIFGGGATDAAESARIGILATTIIAMPTNIVREGMVYHTRNDTVEFIEPEVVEGCLKIACDYLLKKDKEIK